MLGRRPAVPGGGRARRRTGSRPPTACSAGTDATRAPRASSWRATRDGAVRITDHESGRRDLQLIKITGSAFADFARDEHTTLPERPDRPLYIW